MTVPAVRGVSQPSLFPAPTGSYWKRPFRTDRMMREGADTWPQRIYDSECYPGEQEQLKEWGWKHVTVRGPVMPPDNPRGRE